MRIHHRTFCLLILLAYSKHLSEATKHSCPSGFTLSTTLRYGRPLCYKQKGPEHFHDTFKDCVGNQYTSELYNSLNLKSYQVLWTQFKSLYPGGPFVDWSYTKSAGNFLQTTYDVKYDPSLGLDEELCVVIDPVSNFTATRCNEKHYRYCIVDPYPDKDEMSREGCSEFSGSWRFFSPVANCLMAVTGIGGGTVRATWRQAQDLCSKRGGSLLNRGWMYSNNSMLTSGAHSTYPMGIVMNSDHDMLRYDTDWDKDEVKTLQNKLNSIFSSMALRSMRYGVRSWKLSNVGQSLDGRPKIYYIELLRALESTLIRWSQLNLQSLAPTNPLCARVVVVARFPYM
jgi:hypothetical protein